MSGDHTEVSHYYTIDSFVEEGGMIELLVRFKGTSDGHLFLSEFANNSDPSYIVSLLQERSTNTSIKGNITENYLE